MASDSKRVFVFDLDFTLWDAGGTWCDCTTPPYRNLNEHIVDHDGSIIQMYKDVRAVLALLSQQGKVLAIASRTMAPRIAEELLERFGIRHYFEVEEIYPTSKKVHLTHIINAVKSAPEEIVFFDDELRNIREVSEMGVTCVHIISGLEMSQIKPFL